MTAAIIVSALASAILGFAIGFIYHGTMSAMVRKIDADFVRERSELIAKLTSYVETIFNSKGSYPSIGTVPLEKPRTGLHVVDSAIYPSVGPKTDGPKADGPKAG